MSIASLSDKIVDVADYLLRNEREIPPEEYHELIEKGTPKGCLYCKYCPPEKAYYTMNDTGESVYCEHPLTKLIWVGRIANFVNNICRWFKRK
jgi:hypothetical protein